MIPREKLKDGGLELLLLGLNTPISSIYTKKKSKHRGVSESAVILEPESSFSQPLLKQ